LQSANGGLETWSESWPRTDDVMSAISKKKSAYKSHSFTQAVESHS
jgi:hypothetical protein